ncbi:MAG: hypothetical protein WD294_14475 [Phycisphaeraceae bacterium]
MDRNWTRLIDHDDDASLGSMIVRLARQAACDHLAPPVLPASTPAAEQWVPVFRTVADLEAELAANQTTRTPAEVGR